ncbi:MAG: hypothetical protein E7H33_09365 [Clostridium perfringens]|nr:hypothetical protein [Clostridium perfringens]
MNEIKIWDNEKYFRAYLRKNGEYRRKEFIQEYIEYIENWNEEYYFGDIEGYTHEHIEHLGVF